VFKRSLALPAAGAETFFLWGPRQSGKTTLLREAYPGARWLDLLKSDELRRYGDRPELLRQELQAEPANQVVIDEIQKIPALLDEVHWLIENTSTRFALCGSSARKLKRGAANLLGGRALRYELFGMTAFELGNEFDLDRMLNRGYLPRIYVAERAGRMLAAYVADYLREEIAAEGLVRNLPVFSRFLDAAALSDGDLVNASHIARDCGVSTPTVQSYFEILVDTLLGRWLPAYTKRPKRRVIQGPKFFFADVGVVNQLAKRGALARGGELYGKALENWVFHELTAAIAYRESTSTLSYWRLASGIEVDFVIDDVRVAIEVKASANISGDHLKGLRAIAKDHPRVSRRIVVCLEPRRRNTDEGIEILPIDAFLKEVASGSLFA
jgi:uncharacterized protein